MAKRPQRIVFHFAPDEAGRKWIQQIMIFYPEDADMAAVQQAMVAEYGPGVSTYTTSYVLRAEGSAGEGETYVAATEEVTGGRWPPLLVIPFRGRILFPGGIAGNGRR